MSENKMSEEIKLPIKSHHCKTTHTACDCVLQRLKEQDQRIAELEAENKRLKEQRENDLYLGFGKGDK